MAEKQDQKEKEMSFLEHLEELRWHIIRSLFAIVIFAIVVFLAKEFVFENIIFAPRHNDFLTYRVFCSISSITCFSPPEFLIIPREFGEKFFTHLKISFWLGFIISFPYIFWEFWKFVKPGLYSNEQKAARGIVFVCSLLFLLGVLFGYFIISPFAKDVLEAEAPPKYGLPMPNISSRFIFAKEDYFFLYPNNFAHFNRMYTDTFQHGGISLEEIICPFVKLETK